MRERWEKKAIQQTFKIQARGVSLCVCVSVHVCFSLLGQENEEDSVRQRRAAGSLITLSRSLTQPHHFRLYWEQRLLTAAHTHKHTHTTVPDAISTERLTISQLSISYANSFMTDKDIFLNYNSWLSGWTFVTDYDKYIKDTGAHDCTTLSSKRDSDGFRRKRLRQ